jgi:hypothetical protein
MTIAQKLKKKKVIIINIIYDKRYAKNNNINIMVARTILIKKKIRSTEQYNS